MFALFWPESWEPGSVKSAMTRDEALNADPHRTDGRDYLQVATGTDGDMWFRTFRGLKGDGTLRWEETERLAWLVPPAYLIKRFPELATCRGHWLGVEWAELDPEGVDWLPGRIDPPDQHKAEADFFEVQKLVRRGPAERLHGGVFRDRAEGPPP